MQTKSVLIIEDEEGIRETLQMALELERYDVWAAANGKEGLLAIEQMRPPGIILLDLMMPVMDGWEFAAAIGKDPRFSTVPIVVMTAFADKAHSVPARRILKKPLSLDEVLDVVGRYCAGSPPADERRGDVDPSPTRGIR